MRAEALEGGHPGAIAHPCGQGAEQHTPLDEGPGLAPMHILDRSHRQRLAHGSEIDRLAARHARGAGGAGQHPDHLESLRRAVTGHRVIRQHGKSECLQRVADQDRSRFVVGTMTGGAAASQIVIIHGGQVVVN